jgi:uncharacterized protein YbjQ (UPF0145 family)
MAELIIFIILMGLGYFFGQWNESQHYKSLIQREGALNTLPAIASKKLTPELSQYDTRMVTGSVVISVDYFKKFLAGLRILFGGRVTSYETLVDRARREAVLRMKQQAKDVNAEYIFNIKMETASISKGQKNSIGSVEVLAYGTALIPPAKTF